MKKFSVFLLITLSILFIPSTSYAENNKIGISLLQPSTEDIQGAAQLINGGSGDWGYVTLVIQENDRDVRKWQDIFEHLRENHLIPIIRLATSPQGEVWRRPEEKDASDWVQFLLKLNWVVKKRYISLFNEPNHASEWGGEVDPATYTKVSLAFAKAIKESNDDYVVMLAGLDGAAPQYTSQFWDSGEFVRAICRDEGICKELFFYIDGWASHSYPNPGFSGSVWDTGKKSIKGYDYELQLLRELGITKELPVFITETGWTNAKLSEETIAENYKIAYTQIWGNDRRIQAITPFVFKYLSEPFIGFSWKKNEGYSAQYNVVKELPKQRGTPEQVEKGQLSISLPNTLIARSTYHFSISLKNEGQAIWDQEGGYQLNVISDVDDVKTLISDIHTTKPFEENRITITLKTPSKPQNIEVAIQLKRNGQTILETNKHRIQIEPFPELAIKTTLFPKLVSNGDGFEVQLFDKQEELVFSKKGVSMRNGKIEVGNISDIIPGERYRVVLIGYPYVPRQEIKTLKKGVNLITLKKLFPFDADGNGKMDINDLRVAVMNPGFFLRFVPWNQL